METHMQKHTLHPNSWKHTFAVKGPLSNIKIKPTPVSNFPLSHKNDKCSLFFSPSSDIDIKATG